MISDQTKNDLLKLGLFSGLVIYAGCVWTGHVRPKLAKTNEPIVIYAEAKEPEVTSQPETENVVVESASLPLTEEEGTEQPSSEVEGSIEEIIREVFGEDARTAIAVAKCESGLRHEAINDNRTWGGVGVDYSIFQINDYYHRDKGDIANLTAEENIRMAKRIKDASGWGAWVCFKRGLHKKFL